MDGDNFKSVNDTLGHAAGDEVLVGIAERLSQIAGQSHMVCRFGGDEFAMILEDISTDYGLLAVIEAVDQKMLEPIYLHNGDNIIVTLSTGWALASKAGNAQELMELADRSMYNEKKSRT
ncbi:diguanylate cyclase domain-containing protein [Erwinia billingiae]|uniref:diguanylate cyclase domain-containing protein n=1 Tax=Erwinia billingiae TaxID=182337 RepID=UPI0019D00F8A